MLCLAATVPVESAHASDSVFSSGDGSASSPFVISAPSDLLMLSNLVSVGAKTEGGVMYSALNYILGDDIDMSGVDFSPIGGDETLSSLTYYLNATALVTDADFADMWEIRKSSIYVRTASGYESCADSSAASDYAPGTEFYILHSFTSSFFGTFDGRGKTISNLSVDSRLGGLFGVAVFADIKNITLTDSSVRGEASAGGIVAECYASSITDCAILSSSVTASDIGGSAGGAVGKTSDITYGLYTDIVFDSVASVSSGEVSFIATVDSCISATNAGGIIGTHANNPLHDVFSSVTPTGENSGAVVGLLESESVTSFCLALSPLFGEISPISVCDSCIYPSDLFTDPVLPCDETSQSLALGNLSMLEFDREDSRSWERRAPSGGTYYYPTPLSYVNIGFTAYTVSIDETMIAFLRPDGIGGTDFTLPEYNISSVPNGYEFAFYRSSERDYLEGASLSVVSDLSLTSYFILRAPLVTDIVVACGENGTFSAEYNSSEQTAILASYENPYGLTSVLSCYRSSDGIDFSRVEDFDGTVSIKNVGDGGYYKFSVTVYADPSVPTVEVESVSSETEVYCCEITPKSATVSMFADIDGHSSVTYTGEILEPDITIICNGIYAADIPRAEGGLITDAAVEIKNVSEYIISGTLSLSNYEITVIPATFTVTPATVTASVIGYVGVYDGLLHGITLDALTVDESSPTATYYVNDASYAENPLFSDVCDLTVRVVITAENHFSTELYESVTITPAPVTLSPAEGSPLVKVYDSTASFPVEYVTDSHFAASYTGPFSGEFVTVTQAVANDVIGNVTVTVVFECGSNFTLVNDTLSLTGVINPSTVSIEQKNTVRAIYNGGSSFIYAISPDDYTVKASTSALPVLSIAAAAANSPDVPEANSLTVAFTLSRPSCFVFENGTGIYLFDFELSPIVLTLDSSKLYAIDRLYDGTCDVEVKAEPGALTGASETVTPVIRAHVSSPNADDTEKDVIIDSVLPDSSNYTVADGYTISLTVLISKRTPAINIYVSADSLYESADSLPSITTDGAGVISWAPLVAVNGAIAWSSYPTVDGKKYFGYTFTPDDGVNYYPIESTYGLTVYPVLPESGDISYFGNNVFAPFDTVDFAYISVKIINNDKSVRFLTSDEIDIRYIDGRSCFYANDAYFDIAYDDEFLQLSRRVSVSVDKIKLNVPTGTSFEYTGGVRVFTPAGFDSEFMTLENNIQTDVGIYSSTVSLKPDVALNYEFNGVSVPSVAVSWRITPIKRYQPFLAVSSYTYTGEEITANIRNDYNRTDGFYTAEGTLSATDVGDYEIKIKPTANYIWSETDDDRQIILNWHITPSRVQIPEIYDMPFKYDGESHTVTVTESPYYILSGDTIRSDAGSYEIYADLKDNHNYSWSDGTFAQITLPYTVSPISVPKPTFTTAYTYNGKPFTHVISPTAPYVLSGDARATAKGNYVLTVTLSDIRNYVWGDETVEPFDIEWQILARRIVIPSSVGSSGYTGRTQSAPIYIDEAYCTIANNTASSVGSYVATVSLKDALNTVWYDGTTAAKNVSWEIVPARIAIPSAPENTIYTGLMQKANIPSSDAYSVTGGERTEPGVYSVTVKLNDTVNYVWADGTLNDKTYQWKICRVALSVNNDTSLYSVYSVGGELPSPYIDGYTFKGWYTSSDFSGSPIYSLSAIDGDTVLYAKLEKTQELNFESPKNKYGVLGEKAVIGISVAGGALVISVLIIVLGFVLNGGSGKRKGKKGHGHRPTDSI